MVTKLYKMPLPSLVCSTTGDLSRSDEVLLDSVLGWYNDQSSRVDSFLAIVERKNGMSLRVIDWLVTNFSKTTSVVLEINGVPRDLYRDYQKNLSAYNKRNMDPFARRNKITIMVFGDKARKSTVGQLNFFRWFITNDVGSFLQKNKRAVENDMKVAESRSRESKIQTSRRVAKHKTKSYTGKFMMMF